MGGLFLFLCSGCHTDTSFRLLSDLQAIALRKCYTFQAHRHRYTREWQTVHRTGTSRISHPSHV